MKQKITDKYTETEISEIFSSLQGEGPYLGIRQIFVRFGRCNMSCGYCDELMKMEEGSFAVYTQDALLEEIQRLEDSKGRHESISLTGGEPLYYTSFLKGFLPRLRERGFKVYLETNGALPQQLGEVIHFCDIIAMDMKPPTSTGDRGFWREHEEFLRISLQKDVFVKVVVTADTQLREIQDCIDIVKKVNAKLPFIFQPLSQPFGINLKAMKLIENHFFPAAKKSLLDVRVIPQMHKIWGVR